MDETATHILVLMDQRCCDVLCLPVFFFRGPNKVLGGGVFYPCLGKDLV